MVRSERMDYMQSIHEKLCSINIKRQEINPEVLSSVYKFAAEHKPRRPFLAYIRHFAWAGAAVVAIAAAIVVLSLPQTRKDLTFANIGYYTIDINPSISVQTDGSKNVMSAEGLNDDGKKLLNTVDCDGRPINEALQIILDAARQMGYLDGKNVVIGYFGSGGSGVSMETVSELAGSGKAVLLTGTKKQYEDFIAGGLQPGLELLELEGAKLGLEEGSPYSDIIAALIESSLPATDKPSATPLPSSSPTPQPTKEPASEPTEKPTAYSTRGQDSHRGAHKEACGDQNSVTVARTHHRRRLSAVVHLRQCDRQRHKTKLVKDTKQRFQRVQGRGVQN